MNRTTPSAGEATARRLLYFDLADGVSRSTTTEALQRACKACAEALGYERYLFGGYYPAVEGIVISSDFPSEWRERYDGKGYVAFDPVVKHCWTESRPIVWEKVSFSEGKAGELERAVMAEAATFGLRSGISLPVHGSGAEGGMLSLASSREQASLEIHDEAGLQIVAQAMHEATKRITSRTSGSSRLQLEQLTPREIECLSWTAKGKTSWETSRILGVSESTVIFHLKKAIQKLEVTNRSHAVAKAITHSKITPF